MSGHQNGLVQATVFVRGTTVLFEATFLDSGGLPAAPAQVEITLSYFVAGVVTAASYAMVFNFMTGVWAYTWKNTGFDPSMVEWSIRTDPGANETYAADGSFVLAANLANQGAATPLP